MPVIINDFEIISAPPAPAAQQEPVSAPRQEQAMPVRAEDIERIQQHLQQRQARIWAE